MVSKENPAGCPPARKVCIKANKKCNFKCIILTWKSRELVSADLVLDAAEALLLPQADGVAGEKSI